ncbi:glycosyltransferase [bacterium]|nr:glycosyltransferase [bacterium]
MTTSFIIPTMWRSNLTPRLLNALHVALQSGVISEVIIIDNDPSARPQGLLLDGFRVLKQTDNIGVNPAWNLGAKESQSDLIALCNDDLAFDICRWWPMVTEHFAETNGTILGLHPAGFNRTSEQLAEDAGQIQAGHHLGSGWGCLLAMRRHDYADVPEAFALHYGDNWLAKHLRALSWRLPCRFEASATVSALEFRPIIEREQNLATAMDLNTLSNHQVTPLASGSIGETGFCHRAMAAADTAAIHSGFEQSFHVKRQPTEWSWRYNRPWSSSIQQVGLNDKNQPIAHVGWVPERAQIQGHPVTCLQGGDVFRIDEPQRATLSLIADMHHAMFAYIDGNPEIAWSFGFQAPRIRARSKRSYNIDGEIPLTLYRAKSLPQKTTWLFGFQPKSAVKIPSAEPWAAQLNHLWNRCESRYPTTIIRDGLWFSYRYDHHPAKEYVHVASFKDRQQTTLAAWGTIGVRLGTAMLVDLIWDGQNEASLQTLFKTAQRVAHGLGFESITAWIEGDPDATDILLDLPDWTAEEDPQQLGFVIRHSHPALHRSDYPRRHYVTAGYSDLV